MNIIGFLEEKVLHNADKVYLYYEDQQWSYQQFNDRVNQFANIFLELGICKGDRACIMMKNSPEFLFAWYGLNKIGAIMVPINTGFKIPEVQYIIDHCRAKGIIVDTENLDIATSVRDNGLNPNWVGLIDKQAQIKNSSIDLLRLCNKSSISSTDITIQDQDTAAIIYTSGTTGLPKGVMHSHQSFVLCGQAMTLRAGLTSGDKLMVILPFFHANALFYSVMGSLAAEASMIIIPRFSANHFWGQAKRYGATQFNFIGVIGRILMARPIDEFEDEHHIRVANGAYIPRDVYQAFTQRFKIPHVLDGYGLTECPSVSQNPINGIKKIGSMGLPAKHPNPSIQFTELKIVDDEGQDLPVGKTGELLVRSPVLMKGYFRNSKETSNAMRGGWFHTGDYCYQDEEGYFFFVDRKKDIIRCKGENISSVEIESVINSNPKVLESAVIAVPSALSEDEVKAFIVLKSGLNLSPEELINWCFERLANFKIPRYLEYRESLPKTSTQRIAKYLLKGSSEEGWIDMSRYIHTLTVRGKKVRK